MDSRSAVVPQAYRETNPAGYTVASYQLPATSFQLPASSFQLPASSYSLLATSYFVIFDPDGD